MREQSCPVCGYDLGFDAWRSGSASDEICPSCGIQFGYDDAAHGDPGVRAEIYLRWRQDWIEAGMPWRSVGVPAPDGWDPKEQLKAVTNANSD